MKATKKPITIDYFPIEDYNNEELHNWVQSFGDKFEDKFFEFEAEGFIHLEVNTLEGSSYEITTDDVIIRGIKGEYYPCKKDVFELTYDKID